MDVWDGGVGEEAAGVCRYTSGPLFPQMGHLQPANVGSLG